jgi:curved DNA-binding protein
VKFRDYYEVLGVERSSTPEAIRKAFRKLARKYHPDVAENKEEAEAKFKELNEAYEVLSDPEKRRKYDRLGPNWEHMSEFTPPPGAGGFGGASADEGGYEYHFDGTGFSDFFEHLFGQRSRRGGMSGFGGFGTRGGFGQGGAGVPPVSMRGRDIEAEILVSLDEVMQGSQRVLTLQRGSGGRAGERADTIRVKIPRGVVENQLIRCAGLGEPGIQGGEAGDLFLRVILQRHPDFRVEGSDLYQDLALLPWDAVLGTTVRLSTPHGTLQLSVPEHSTAGTELRLRGKGLPQGDGASFGDLFVKLAIDIPEKISASQRALWEQLRKESA